MFFKKDVGLVEKQVYRLYILEITFESGMKVVKIGKSSGCNSVDRMFKIQRDYFNKYRTTFLCKIKRDRECEDVFTKETELHRFFKEFQYKPKMPFDGSTELFVIPVESAIEAYEWILDGNSLDEYVYELPKEGVDELTF